jgi:hypothetical protein
MGFLVSHRNVKLEEIDPTSKSRRLGCGTQRNNGLTDQDERSNRSKGEQKPDYFGHLIPLYPWASGCSAESRHHGAICADRRDI